MDMLLGCIKEMQGKQFFNDKFKCILTSATINLETFKSFLGNCNTY